jgi:hypothetical protein
MGGLLLGLIHDLNISGVLLLSRRLRIAGSFGDAQFRDGSPHDFAGA